MDPAGTVGLFKVYSAIMALLYGTLLAAAVAVPLMGLEFQTEDMITFLIMGLVSLPFLALFGFGLFLPRTKWAWVMGLIMIVIGLSSCCFWPICIPLLLKWIEPQTKDWFENSALSHGAGTDGW